MIEIDVAIVGGGPAGLQAALVLARTRKRIAVFDAPASPRNGASHGVHNFVGLDGLLPAEIRNQAWSQIDRYGSAVCVGETVTAIRRSEHSQDLVVSTESGQFVARHVVLTCGYHDRFPEIDGFSDCWADTIIACPFCDGYENRDRVWGIVPSIAAELDTFPAMTLNWTAQRLVIAPPALEVSEKQRAMLADLGVPLHVGNISSLSHQNGKLEAVTTDTGETIDVETLLWTPDQDPTPLVTGLVDSLGLELDENSYVQVDGVQRTNVDRLWAAGDVQGLMGALDAANAGGMAAFMIVHDWFEASSAPADQEAAA